MVAYTESGRFTHTRSGDYECPDSSHIVNLGTTSSPAKSHLVNLGTVGLLQICNMSPL